MNQRSALSRGMPGERVTRCLLRGPLLAFGLAAAGCSGEIGEAFERAGNTLARAFEPSDQAPTTDGEVPSPAAEAAYGAGLKARKNGAPDQAFRSFLEAADFGHGAAAYEVSRAYAEGRGTARDLDAAAEWTNRAAARGDPRAQFLVGSAYYGGIGVERDYKLAGEYLIQSARQGHAQAQYLLGEAYSNGRGVARDEAWAARWYGKAATQGLGEAQYAYGAVHAAGLGVPKNPRLGYAWLHLAASDGHENAKILGRVMAARLSPEQMTWAESWAARFSPRPDTVFPDEATVIYVQHALNRRGHHAGTVDGIAGPRTRSAVRSFQEKAGLKADGRITSGLIDNLRAMPPKQS